MNLHDSILVQPEYMHLYIARAHSQFSSGQHLSAIPKRQELAAIEQQHS
jgi:hypothetical protein